ncbi:MAG: T9SS type A sorting domain-containing protein [Bacteroidales bacterium]|nr:T9SS type A sorting domain-containing protein [Bacteroidales bacterium]
MDNVEVASVFSCSRPIGLEANNITNTSALLSWSTTGNEDSWTIELDGVETEVTTQPYLMQGLTPQTQYTFRVKANCGNDSESDWSLPVVFTTFCDVYVVTDEVPYFDDFESSDEFVCWQTEIISGIDNWTVDPGYLIHNNTAFLIWLGGEARLISLPMDLTTVTNPALSFMHKHPQVLSNFDEMSVWYRTSLEDEWHSIQEYAYPAEELETELITLPNPSSTYQISFVGTCHNGGGIYVDNVKVGKKSVVGIEERSDFTVSVTPNPTKGLVVITADMTNGEAVVYDMFGKQVSATAVVNGRAEFDLGNCANGIYVVRLIGAEGVHTVKLVKE